MSGRRRGGTVSRHALEKLRAKEGAATVMLADRFEVSAVRARTIRTVLLSPDGERGHPTPDHRVSGPAQLGHASRVSSTWQEELNCIACHDPHKGRSRHLLRWNLSEPAEACLKCHPK